MVASWEGGEISLPAVCYQSHSCAWKDVKQLKSESCIYCTAVWKLRRNLHSATTTTTSWITMILLLLMRSHISSNNLSKSNHIVEICTNKWFFYINALHEIPSLCGLVFNYTKWPSKLKVWIPHRQSIWKMEMRKGLHFNQCSKY